jgi:hypothetical protein
MSLRVKESPPALPSLSLRPHPAQLTTLQTPAAFPSDHQRPPALGRLRTGSFLCLELPNPLVEAWVHSSLRCSLNYHLLSVRPSPTTGFQISAHIQIPTLSFPASLPPLRVTPRRCLPHSSDGLSFTLYRKTSRTSFILFIAAAHLVGVQYSFVCLLAWWAGWFF